MSNIALFYMMFMSVNIDNQDKMDHAAVSIFNMLSYQRNNLLLDKFFLFHSDCVRLGRITNEEDQKQYYRKHLRNNQIYKANFHNVLFKKMTWYNDDSKIACRDVYDLVHIDDHVMYLIQGYRKIYFVFLHNEKCAFHALLFFAPNDIDINQSNTDIRYCHKCDHIDIFYNSKPGCCIGMRRYMSMYNTDTTPYFDISSILHVPVSLGTQDMLRSILNAGGYLTAEDDKINCR